MTRRKGGSLATDLAGERREAARAEHAVRRRVVGGSVTVAGITVAAVLGMALVPDTPPSQQTQRAASTATATPSDVAAAEGATLTPRGTIAKRLGEIAGFGPANDPGQNTFAVDEIIVDPPCDVGYRSHASEHVVRLHVTVHTGSDARRAGMLGRILTPGFFEAVGHGGRRHEAWPAECSDAVNASTALADSFEPNRDYSRTIELRLPVRSGILILNGVMSNAAGWEWRF